MEVISSRAEDLLKTYSSPSPLPPKMELCQSFFTSPIYVGTTYIFLF